MTIDALDPAADLEQACAAVLDNLAFPIGGDPVKYTVGVVEIGPDDLNSLLDEFGAVVHVYRAGGAQRNSWQRTVREAVTVYAETRTDAWAAQDAIEAVVGGPYRPNTSPGDGGIRIDSWRNESAATKQPYPGLYVLSSIWRVTTRHMPA